MARQAWIATARIADLGPQALALARRRLGPLDRKRFARIRSHRRRREFLAARCLLLRLGKGLPFDAAPRGGLRMAGRFGASVAHARGWVACVVASSGRPGIDIEPMVKRDFAALGEWMFGARTSRREFYERWTRYEARIKAFGDGRPRASHVERSWVIDDAVAVAVCLPARAVLIAA